MICAGPHKAARHGAPSRAAAIQIAVTCTSDKASHTATTRFTPIQVRLIKPRTSMIGPINGSARLVSSRYTPMNLRYHPVSSGSRLRIFQVTSKDAVGPAEALVPQTLPSGWNLRIGVGPWRKLHLPTTPPHCHRQIRVLGKGVGWNHTDVFEDRTAECADGTGNTPHDSDLGLHPSVETATKQVFGILQLGDKAVQIGDPWVAAHCPNPPVGKRCDEPFNRPRLKHCVGIDQDDKFVRRGFNPCVERGRLAAVGLPNQPD